MGTAITTSKSDNNVVSLKKHVDPLSFEPSNLQIPLCFPLSSVSPFHGMAGKQMKGIIPSLNTFTLQFDNLQSVKSIPDFPVVTYCCPEHYTQEKISLQRSDQVHSSVVFRPVFF